jgi:hypothetical protein
MYKYLYLSLFFAAFAIIGCRQMEDNAQAMTASDMRGDTISNTLLMTLDSAGVKQRLLAASSTLGFIEVKYKIEVRKIIYKTLDPFGNITQASGLCIIPINSPKVQGIASYQHGTIVRKEDAPSRPDNAQESLVGVILASTLGITVSMPDYLGLGDSPGMHPYVHAKTEASAGIDMLRATKKYLGKRKIAINDQLFLFGYSQGGHATMAMHRELEANHKNEFKVTASAPMAGPYDVSGVQTKVLIDTLPYPAPDYLPYITLAYNYVYKLYGSPDEFLKPPYNTTIPPLLRGNNGGGEIVSAMGGTILPPNHIFRPEVLADFVKDSIKHKLRIALKDNDVYNWKPIAPIMFCHCNGDDHVSPKNTTVAYNKFIANGVPASNLQRKIPDLAGPPVRHTACAVSCLLEGLAYIGTFVQ